MEKSLTGKNFVVTGAGSGIGRAIALKIASQGAFVLVSDINKAAANAVAVEIKNKGGASESTQLDVTNREACIDLARSISTTKGRLDGWINNAGVSSMNRLVELSEADWDFNMDINAKGTFFGTQAAAQIMMNQSPDPQSGLRGKIINVASMASKRGNAPFLAHYVASKFAVLGFTQAAAGELAENHITVNSVCPGYVATSMQDRELAWEAQLRGVTVEEVKRLYIADTPLRRLETPEDVAKVVSFLASSDADFITGEAININGGAFMD